MITYEHNLTLSVKPVASGQGRLRIDLEGQPPDFLYCAPRQASLLLEQLARAYELVRSQGGSSTPRELKALVTRLKQ